MSTNLIVYALPLDDIKHFIKDLNKRTDEDINKLTHKFLLQDPSFFRRGQAEFWKEEYYQHSMKCAEVIKNSINTKFDLDKIHRPEIPPLEWKKSVAAHLLGTIFNPIDGFSRERDILFKIIEILSPYLDKNNKLTKYHEEVEEAFRKNDNFSLIDKKYYDIMKSEFGVISDDFESFDNGDKIFAFYIEKLPIGVEFQNQFLEGLTKEEIFENSYFIREIIDLIARMRESNVKYLAYRVS